MKRFFVAIAVLSTLCLRASAQEKLYRPAIDAKLIAATYATDWCGVYLEEKKIGYFMSKREALEKDKVRDSFLMSMKIASFGKKVEVRITQEMVFEMAPPHRLLRAEMAQSSGPVNTRTVVEKTDKGYRALLTSAGVERKKELPDLDFTLGDAMASEVWLRGGPKEKDAIAYRDLSLEELRVDSQTSTVLARKTTPVGGVEVPFFEVETLNNRTKTRMKTLNDDQGRLLSGKVAVFELRRETEEQAKNTEFSSDLFVLGSVKVDKTLGRTEALEELVLEVVGKGGEAIPDGPWQKVEVDKDGKRVIRIGKKHGKALRASEKDIKEALEETTALPITDPKIVELAKEAVGDAKTPQEKVKRIVNFTHKFIKPSLTTNPPDIHYLLERKSGDCKCYARLFCVLARASGLPAREVSGFVYMGDFVRAFGGHAWNEVLLDGVWVPLDASLNRTEVTAGHVYLGADRESAGILETLGRIQFRFVDSKSAK